MDAEVRDGDPRQAAQAGENQALGQEQPDQPEAPGAQRQPYGDFARSGAGAAQEQSRDVRARHQQHRQRQHQEDHGKLPVDVVTARPHFEPGVHRRASVAIELRVLALEILRQHGELAPRLRERRARFQARLHAQLAVIAILEKPLVRVGGKQARHRERHVEIGAREDLHSRERFRCDADHGEGGAVQANGPADDGGVAPEFVLPEVAPEHHDGIATGHRVFVLAKTTPQSWLDAEHVEVVTGNDHSTLDARRRPGFDAEADRRHDPIRDHAVVALGAGADVQVLAIGEEIVAIVARVADQSDHAALMRHRVRPEDQRIDHAESRRGHPDPERERDDHERSQPGSAAQTPDRVADVVEEVRQPADTPHVSHLFLSLFQSAHRAHRRVARVARG